MKALNPRSIHPPFAAYSHGVSAEAKKTVFTSGQLGIGIDGFVPEGSMEQANLCFRNIENILQEAGLSRSNIVRINAYVTGREHMAGYMKARDVFIGEAEVLPASTLMIVAGFTRPEFLVEVEAIAVEEI